MKDTILGCLVFIGILIIGWLPIILIVQVLKWL